jgi:hypothetical protein
MEPLVLDAYAIGAITNLVKRPELNGTRGVVTCNTLNSRGRISVWLFGVGNVIALKPSNFEEKGTYSEVSLLWLAAILGLEYQFATACGDLDNNDAAVGFSANGHTVALEFDHLVAQPLAEASDLCVFVGFPQQIEVPQEGVFMTSWSVRGVVS